MKLLVAITLVLSGCASVFDTPFVAEFDRGPNVPIRYFYVENEDQLQIACRNFDSDKVGKKLLGCAAIPADPKGVCVVALYRGFPDVQEHEEKHCRYGRWHS
jgi:hypothetical protein